MTIERKVGMGIAGQPSGGPTDVADVFSTHLYTGDYGAGTVVNGIDLAGEGGMVWTKARNYDDNHVIIDTEGGGSKWRRSNYYSAHATANNMITSFNSNGYTRGNNGNISDQQDFVSWTFRKKKKFFDIVTWSGNSTAGRQISHGLDGPVGFMICGCTSEYTDWSTYNATDGAGKYNKLNGNYNSISNTNIWNNTAPTSTHFTVGTLGQINETGKTYTAYLFADNSAEDAEDQMIKCGSYTGTGAAGLEVNLGWEPQWVLIKNTSRATGWMMQDTMRGMSHNGWQYLLANASSAESGDTSNRVVPTATGFTVNNNGGNDFGQSGDTLVYMAIRAPMMVEPEAATDVFAVAARTGASGDTPTWVSGFVTDMTIQIEPALANKTVGTRQLGGNVMYTDAINAEGGGGGKYIWDYMTGLSDQAGAYAPNKELMWKRAKGFMDVVCYSGTGSARTVPHSLGVAPEMMWFKRRNTDRDWITYDAPNGATKFMYLNRDQTSDISSVYFNDVTPTDSVFTVNTNNRVNGSGDTYIAYLFASLAGISKVGSYTGNGSSQTISCGFSAGSRFVLIKSINASGDWYVWNSLSGIVAGNDPHLSLNTSAAEVTTDDSLDPANAGFIVNQVSATNINVSSATYIFYAIA